MKSLEDQTGDKVLGLEVSQSTNNTTARKTKKKTIWFRFFHFPAGCYHSAAVAECLLYEKSLPLDDTEESTGNN